MLIPRTLRLSNLNVNKSHQLSQHPTICEDALRCFQWLPELAAHRRSSNWTTHNQLKKHASSLTHRRDRLPEAVGFTETQSLQLDPH